MFVYFLVFALLVFGLFSVFNVRLAQFAKTAAKVSQPPSTYEIVTGDSGNLFTRRIKAQFKEMHDILKLAGEENKYDKYCRMALVLAIIGAIIAIVLENIFLLPVITLLGLFIPLLLSRRSASNFRRRLNEEILTSLSIISSSYKRTDDLLLSVSENIGYIHEPVKSVLKAFLAQNEFITSNVEKSLVDMKEAIGNDTWREWCETMILCQHDRTQKDMLDPILNKLRNMYSVQIELDTEMYGPVRDFIQMVVLVFINFPILYFLNRSWFYTLFFSIPGKIALTFVAGAILYSLFTVIRATSPIEYKR